MGAMTDMVSDGRTGLGSLQEIQVGISVFIGDVVLLVHLVHVRRSWCLSLKYDKRGKIKTNHM